MSDRVAKAQQQMANTAEHKAVAAIDAKVTALRDQLVCTMPQHEIE